MAEARCCDRCDKLYKGQSVKIHIFDPTALLHLKEVELCDDCYAEFNFWLNNSNAQLMIVDDSL